MKLISILLVTTGLCTGLCGVFTLIVNGILNQFEPRGIGFLIAVSAIVLGGMVIGLHYLVDILASKLNVTTQEQVGMVSIYMLPTHSIHKAHKHGAYLGVIRKESK